MKFVRFRHESITAYGLWEETRVRPIDGNPFSGYKPTQETLPIHTVCLLAPCEPSKIVAVGVNYTDHAAEFKHPLPKEPILFLKPSTAVLAPHEVIQLPNSSSRVDFEGELGVVIKKRASRISPEQTPDFVLGYTCFNDVTARDLQKQDRQWTRAKSFDTFAPFGPCIATDLNPNNLTVETYLNGERRQSANTAELLFNVPTLVSFISNVMTLLPGDLIATGTPAGVGPMHTGDVVEIVIREIGKLTNPVK